MRIVRDVCFGWIIFHTGNKTEKEEKEVFYHGFIKKFSVLKLKNELHIVAFAGKEKEI